MAHCNAIFRCRVNRNEASRMPFSSFGSRGFVRVRHGRGDARKIVRVRYGRGDTITGARQEQQLLPPKP
jgi:hypothetical protein